MNIADVLSGSAGLEGIRWLLLSAPARKVLKNQLRALLPAGAAVELCLKEVRFKPGRKITAHYDALVIDNESPQGQQVRPVAVTWGPMACANQQEETVDLEKMQAEAAGRGVAAPFLQLMTDLPEWNMHIRVSPLDARFTQLPRLWDPRHVRAILADVYAPADPAPAQRPIRDYTITCMRYRMNSRHVLRYDPVGPAKGEAVFAKPYIGESGALAFQVARAVADWLTERGEGVHCPRPLAHVTQDAVILYPQVFGTPVCEHLGWRTDALAGWLEQTGAALYTLHCLPKAVAGPLEIRNFATEVQAVARAGSHMHTLLPQLGAAVEALLDRARELHGRLPQEPPTFTHRDFKSVHVWIAPGRLTVIDFDRARFADPASDVGDFLASLQWRHAVYKLPGLVRAQDRFLAGYAAGAPTERLLRARLYEAISLVKCAVRRVQLFEDGCVPQMTEMLCRAEAVMNDLRVTLGSPVRQQSPDNHDVKLQPNGKPSVGYVVCVWPRLSETFILNEVIGLERLGARLRIFSIKEPKDQLVHAKVMDVRAPVTCLSIERNKKAIWLANIRLFWRRPVRYIRTILKALGYGRLRVLRRFFQASYLAEILLREPLTYLHAHFAHTSAVVSMFTHHLMGIPYGFTAHAKDIYVETPPELLRAEAQSAEAVITCTEYNRRYIASQIGPAGNRKLHCIYHGLDLSQFKFCCRRGLGAEPPVILSVARLIEKKGLSDLILAADILQQRGRHFQVEIVGNGPLRQSLEDQVKQLGLNDQVRFLGVLPQEKLFRVYQRVCLFALPCVLASDGDRDGIPNVLLEAMAGGVPVVSTPVSGIPELIQSEVEGLLVPPNSPAKLADALDRLLNSPELRERLALAARAKIETCFSIERNSAQLLSLFEQVGANENSLLHSAPPRGERSFRPRAAALSGGVDLPSGGMLGRPGDLEAGESGDPGFGTTARPMAKSKGKA